MKKKKRENNTMGVASANECTGLIPANPENDLEEETYGELENIPGAKKKK